MNKLLEYIEERSSMCGCNPNKWECDKYLKCDACMKDKIAEHDAKVRADEQERILSIVSHCIPYNVYNASEGIALLYAIKEELKEKNK